jgi:hypothetical protein
VGWHKWHAYHIRVIRPNSTSIIYNSHILYVIKILQFILGIIISLIDPCLYIRCYDNFFLDVQLRVFECN